MYTVSIERRLHPKIPGNCIVGAIRCNVNKYFEKMSMKGGVKVLVALCSLRVMGYGLRVAGW